MPLHVHPEEKAIPVHTCQAQSREQAFHEFIKSACIRKRSLSRMILRGVLQAVILLPNVRGVCFYGHGRWAVCCPWLSILQDAAARLAGHPGRAGHWARIQGVGGAGGIRCHSAGRAVLQPVDVFCERSRRLHPTLQCSTAFAEYTL